MEPSVKDIDLESLITNILRPIVEADGGTLTVLRATHEEVVLQLGGVCMGCPGVFYTQSHVLEPAIRRLFGDSVRILVSADLGSAAK